MLGRGAIHVSMSTVSPGLSRRLAHQHELAGQGYVAAPVLGNPDLAQARKLFVIVSGASPAVGRVSPVLSRLGQRLFLLGDDPGAANLMKVAANALTALTLQSMARFWRCCARAVLTPGRHLKFSLARSLTARSTRPMAAKSSRTITARQE